MSNDNQHISYSMFGKLTDNMVKSYDAKWADLATLFTTHPIVVDDKSSLSVFNGWRYKDVSDPTVDNGTHKDGTPVRNFSSMGVRRIQENLIEMSMLILDFDGAMPLADVQSVFGEYEHASYTSLNHQVKHTDKNEPAADKFRVVLPLLQPLPVIQFRELKFAIRNWLERDGKQLADPKSFSIGQVFLLPAVREEHKANAIAWKNTGKLLDWHVFENFKKTLAPSASYALRNYGDRPSGNKLKPDDILHTSTGGVVVSDINEHISKVLCPFHGDRHPSEFAGITYNGTPFLECKKCGRVYMDRSKPDPIIDGIAKINEKKRLRAAQEGK
jgi:hypothetical protein